MDPFIVDIGRHSCTAGHAGAASAFSCATELFSEKPFLSASGIVEDWSEYEFAMEQLMRKGVSAWGATAALVHAGGRPWDRMDSAQALVYFDTFAQMLLEAQQFAAFTLVPSQAALCASRAVSSAVCVDFGHAETRVGVVRSGEMSQVVEEFVAVARGGEPDGKETPELAAILSAVADVTKTNGGDLDTVVVGGGSAAISGLSQLLESEWKAGEAGRRDITFSVGADSSEVEATAMAWHGAGKLLGQDDAASRLVTQEMYREEGARCLRRWTE